jgi:hypothetical protein
VPGQPEGRFPAGANTPAPGFLAARQLGILARGRPQGPDCLQGKGVPACGVIRQVPVQVLGKTLPLNGAGVCGAALADLGLPLELLRGFAPLARTRA